MDTLDVVIVVLAVAAAVGGYRLGLLGRVASWLGLALGFYVAVRLVPIVMVDLAPASAAVEVVVATLLLLGGAMVGQAIGLVVGARLHRALPLGPLRSFDRAVGAALGAVGVFALLWLLLPSLASVPGWPAQQATGSAISRWESRDLPVPPDALQILRRLIGSNAPQVFSVLTPGAGAGPAPTVSPLDRAVTAMVVASTVEVEGQACGMIYEGSGFAVSPDLVLTNAHVVAGESPGNTYVIVPSGERLAATVVMFDPNRDVALLHVGSLGESPLHLRVAHAGTDGAVFGHPEGTPAVVVKPAAIVAEQEARGENLYDTRPTTRDILVLAASLAHGDSGGPLVDSSGDVIGVAFAISANHSDTAYALSTTEIQGALAQPRSPGGASTGPCLTD